MTEKEIYQTKMNLWLYPLVTENQIYQTINELMAISFGDRKSDISDHELMAISFGDRKSDISDHN